MYSKNEKSLIRKKFWTRFGQYMKPIPSANGERINWLNYKTGIKDIYIRMDADTGKTSIALELLQKDESLRLNNYAQVQLYRKLLEHSLENKWKWEEDYFDENGNKGSRVIQTLNGVNIFNEGDWPAIISFLKPRLIALDGFWSQIKDLLDT